MKEYLVVDIDRCWGCKSCQTSCKREHGYAPNSDDAIEVIRVEGVNQNGQVQSDFVPVMCQHCENPMCLSHCPVNAIVKADDGRVVVDEESCIRCGKCNIICPFGTISLDSTDKRTSRIIKCDLCIERRYRGLQPSCVQHCMGDALLLATSPELTELKKNRQYWSCGQVVYLSSKLTNMGLGIT